MQIALKKVCGFLLLGILLTLSSIRGHAQVTEGVLLNYEIIDERILEDSSNLDVLLRIVVSGQLSKPRLHGMFQRLFDQISSQIDFQPPNTIQHLVVLAYINRAHLHSQELWLAKFEYNKEQPPMVRFNDAHLELLQSGPFTRFGLEESDRKQIWQTFADSQQQITRDIQKNYPDRPSLFQLPDQIFHLRQPITLLFAVPETKNPNAELKGVTHLMPGDEIRFLHSIEFEGREWYFIEVESDQSHDVDRLPDEAPPPKVTGWIDTLHLSKQEGAPSAQYLQKLENIKETRIFEAKVKLIRQYNITFKQFDEIMLEGILRNWKILKTTTN